MAEIKNYADDPVEENSGRFRLTDIAGRFIQRKSDESYDEYDDYDEYENEPSYEKQVSEPFPDTDELPMSFFIGWAIVGACMSILGFIPTLLIGKGAPWLKSALIAVVFGIIVWVAITALAYLFIWPKVMTSLAAYAISTGQLRMM